MRKKRKPLDPALNFMLLVMVAAFISVEISSALHLPEYAIYAAPAIVILAYFLFLRIFHRVKARKPAHRHVDEYDFHKYEDDRLLNAYELYRNFERPDIKEAVVKELRKRGISNGEIVYTGTGKTKWYISRYTAMYADVFLLRNHIYVPSSYANSWGLLIRSKDIKRAIINRGIFKRLAFSGSFQKSFTIVYRRDKKTSSFAVFPSDMDTWLQFFRDKHIQIETR